VLKCHAHRAPLGDRSFLGEAQRSEGFIIESAAVKNLAIKKSGNRSDGEYADDDHHDNQFNQGKSGILRHRSDPFLVEASCRTPGKKKAGGRLHAPVPLIRPNFTAARSVRFHAAQYAALLRPAQTG